MGNDECLYEERRQQDRNEDSMTRPLEAGDSSTTNETMALNERYQMYFKITLLSLTCKTRISTAVATINIISEILFVYM